MVNPAGQGRNRMAEFSTARQSLQRLDARIAALANPRHKAWLATYRDHWWGEATNDVDAVMATMSRGPVRYSFDGHPFMTADALGEIRSWEDTRRMYEGVVQLGVVMAGPFDDEEVFFDDQGLLIRSVLTAIYPGVFLANYAEPVDPQATYLLRWPAVTLIRFDAQGLMMGEEILNGAPLLVRQVERSRMDELMDGPRVTA